MKTSAGWEWEQKYATHHKVIAGIDEVGRGCWAGPLVAAAYVFITIPTDIVVGDSKTIPEKQRLILTEQLKTLGTYGIGEVSAAEVDQLGLQQAQYMAYERAIAALTVQPDILLLDGRPWAGCTYNCESIIDGDAKVASIAAASIIAKTHRDTHMKTHVHEKYPNYAFNKHVGYGTKAHIAALSQHGICPEHRKSFKPIKRFMEETTG